MRHSRVYIYGLIAFIGICTFLMYSYTPYANDDLMYLYPFKGLIGKGDMSGFWDKVLDTWTSRYMTDNTRVANMIVPFTLVLLPKWVMNILNTLMVVMVYIGMIKLLRIRRVWMSVALITSVTFLLPWSDQMLLCDFSLNYVWTSVLLLSVLYLWLKDCKCTPVGLLFLFLLSLVMGAMHEMAAVSLVGGMVAWIIIDRRRMSGRRGVMIVGLLIGVAILLSAPGPYIRAASSAVNALSFDKSMDYYMKVIGRCNVVSAMTIFFGVISLSVRGRERIRQFVRGDGMLYYVASVIGLVIMFYTEKAPRISWYPQLFGLMALSILVRDYMDGKESTQSRYKLLTVAMTAIITVHFVATVYWCHRYYVEYTKVMSLYERSETGVVYYDIIGDRINLLTLGRPLSQLFTADWNLNVITYYYSNGKKPLVVLPLTESTEDVSQE